MGVPGAMPLKIFEILVEKLCIAMHFVSNISESVSSNDTFMVDFFFGIWSDTDTSSVSLKLLSSSFRDSKEDAIR